MNHRNIRRFVLILLLLCISVIFLKIIADETCNDKTIYTNMEISKSANCMEFWLNRYQTLLGVFAALVAAWLAWRGVRMQIRAIDSQIKFARQQTYTSIQDSTSRLISEIGKIKNEIKEASHYAHAAADMRYICHSQISSSVHNRDYFLDNIEEMMAIRKSHIDEYKSQVAEMKVFVDKIAAEANRYIFSTDISEKLLRWSNRAQRICKAHIEEAASFEQALQTLISPPSEFAYIALKVFYDGNPRSIIPDEDDYNVYKDLDRELIRLSHLRDRVRSEIEAEI